MSNEALLRSLSEDRALACATLFEYEDETPAFHLEVLSLWAAADEFVLIEGFRSSAKTTLACAHLSLEALFQNFAFAIIIGDSYDKACEKLEIIRYNLTLRSVRALFGDVLGKKNNEDVMVLQNGRRIQAFGREQSPRGLLYNVARPDRCFLDDIEKDKSDVSSTEAVDARLRWLYGEVIPAMDKNRRKVRVSGTPLARDCMITRLRKDAHWVSRTYPIISGELDSKNCVAMWPARYPVNWVRRQRDMFASQGLLTQFNQEFLCEAEEETEKPFNPNDLVEAPGAPAGWLPKYVMYDPARTSKKSSNLTGKAVVSWQGSRLYVHESSGELWKPSQLIDDVFLANGKHCPIGIGIESDGVDDFVREPLRAAMVERSTSLPLVDLRAPKERSKEDFIKGLQPFSIARDIVLVGGKVKHAQLVAQLRDFPSKNVDVVNALAYSLRMRPGQPVYEDFGPENVVDGPSVLRARPLYLAFNATQKEVTCVAIQIDGQNIVVHDEWIVPGDMNDACESIRMSATGTYAQSRIVSFAPADLVDEWSRVPLVRSLRANGLQPARGGSLLNSRGCLSPYIRTVIRGRRGLVVADHCIAALNGLSAGYAIPINSIGRLADEAVDNHYRTLIQGLECLTAALSDGIDNQAANYATSPEGIRHITSRPGVTFRR
jgi:hypothetical protein